MSACPYGNPDCPNPVRPIGQGAHAACVDTNIMAMFLDRIEAPAAGPHPDRTRYFRAILTDPQIQALETAANLLDAEDREWCERTGIDVSALESAVAVLQTAEVIVP